MNALFAIRPILSSLWRNKTGPLLVAMQVALSLGILVNVIYIVQQRLELAARPSGIANELEIFRVHIANQELGGHENQVALQKREAATIAAVAGVASVARTNSMPVSRSGNNTTLRTENKQGASGVNSGMYYTPDSLVKTWGLQLIEGRDFQPQDYAELDASSATEFPPIAIVSRNLAQSLFPNASSFVDKQFYFGSVEDPKIIRIVGVVERLQNSSASAGFKGERGTISPMRLTHDPYAGYTVRAEPGQRDRVMQEVEQALRRASATPISVNTTSMEQMRTSRYRDEKNLAWTLLTVACLLVLITASGIIGMSSLWVAQRRKQIGVRRALGARRVDILGYFMTENWLITTLGIVFGTLLALALNSLLMAKFELPKLPVSYLLFAPFAFWMLGLAAVYAPAKRAAGISPASATRGA